MNAESGQASRKANETIFAFPAKAVDRSSGKLAVGVVSGLSLNGCLLQSPILFDLGAKLHLELFLAGHRLEISTVVRQVNPSKSLHLEFFALDSAESLQILQDWLAASLSRQPPAK